MRKLFNNIKPSGTEKPDAVPWYTGDDCPTSWEPEELFQLAKKTIRQNYKSGAIDKATRDKMIQELRRQYDSENSNTP